MDEDEEYQYGEMILLDEPAINYAKWKRELEGVVGHTIDATSATTMYDQITGRVPR